MACAYMLVPIICCTVIFDTLKAAAEKTFETGFTKHSCTAKSHAHRHNYFGLINPLS